MNTSTLYLEYHYSTFYIWSWFLKWVGGFKILLLHYVWYDRKVEGRKCVKGNLKRNSQMFLFGRKENKKEKI